MQELTMSDKINFHTKADAFLVYSQAEKEYEKKFREGKIEGSFLEILSLKEKFVMGKVNDFLKSGSENSKTL